MSGSWRIQRVEKELKQVIAKYLLGGFHRPLHGLVTVARVEVSADLRGARVFVSFMGVEDEEASENIDTLKENVGDIQREVSRRLPMKFCPKLRMIWDRGFVHGEHIHKTLKELQDERKELLNQREKSLGEKNELLLGQTEELQKSLNEGED